MLFFRKIDFQHLQSAPSSTNQDSITSIDYKDSTNNIRDLIDNGSSEWFYQQQSLLTNNLKLNDDAKYKSLLEDDVVVDLKRSSKIWDKETKT